MTMFHKIASKGFEIALLLSFSFPIFSLKIGGILVLLLGFFALLTFLSAPTKNFDRPLMIALVLFVSLPIYYLTELFYANDTTFLWSILQRKMALIFIPLSLFLAHLGGIQWKFKTYFLVFAMAVLSLVFFTSFLILTQGVNEEYSTTGGFAFAFRTQVEEIIDLHPTYFSLLIVMSLFIFLENAKRLVQLKQYLLSAGIILALITLFSFLVLLAARMALFSFIIGVMIYAWVSLKTLKMRLSMVTLIVSFLIASFFIFPSISERLQEIANPSDNSTSVRKIIYSCDLEILSENVMFGTGVESLQSKLNACYVTKGMSESHLALSYNTHNEYFNIANAKGILGLFLFVTLIGYMLIRSKNNILFSLFLISILMVCLTENILERQIGVFYFALFGMSFLLMTPSKISSK